MIMAKMDKTKAQLQALYPFLHGEKKSSHAENNALLQSVQQKVDDSVRIKQQFFSNNAQAIINTAKAMADIYLNKGRMLAMGNGGSSCDAAHFSVEFQHPVTTGRPALAAFNLVMDTAMLSAVGNDIGIQHIFVRQLEAHADAKDGLIGFSTSGNSANLLAAYNKAKQMGLVTFGLTGNDGGEMLSSQLVDHCLVVATDSIHRVQEVHVAIYHIIWDLVHTFLADQRGNLHVSNTI